MARTGQRLVDQALADADAPLGWKLLFAPALALLRDRAGLVQFLRAGCAQRAGSLPNVLRDPTLREACA